MVDFTEKTLKAMDMEECPIASRPIVQEIIDMEPLAQDLMRKFMTCVGCVGWLVNTVRLDIAYAHSRISQHMAKPVRGAYDALMHLMRYLRVPQMLAYRQASWVQRSGLSIVTPTMRATPSHKIIDGLKMGL
jgi:hypothetical protein